MKIIELNTTKREINRIDMLKKFVKPEISKRTIAYQIEEGMREQYEKDLKLKRNKRVKKYNMRYV